ncbi:hypothetical protein TrLO_g4758 [Triparma laevis f. longispina]|uniref:Uncharacterized protein n=1 Tax=Triparma laevis f. longispina TaxID=1714387 RepID=A0A9W7DTA8_9STRA|nr:hypothetical protein TrLO_g4758 [Triparma laevis f. longispina]
MPENSLEAEQQERMSDCERRQEAMRLIAQAKPNEISAFLDSMSIALTHFSVTPVLNTDVISHIVTYFGDNKDLWQVAKTSKDFRDSARRQKKQLERNAEFEARVRGWCRNRAASEQKHGLISDWDVSRITNMSRLLYEASQEGHAEIVKLLLNVKGTSVNKVMNNGFTSLCVASWKGKAEVVKLLLADERFDVDKGSKDVATSLYIASLNGHVEVVKLLLDTNGIEVIEATDDSLTQVAKLAFNPGGLTSLYIASRKAHVEVEVAKLAECKLLNTEGCRQFTCLARGVRGHIYVVKLLLNIMLDSTAKKSAIAINNLRKVVTLLNQADPYDSFLSSSSYSDSEQEYSAQPQKKARSESHASFDSTITLAVTKGKNGASYKSDKSSAKEQKLEDHHLHDDDDHHHHHFLQPTATIEEAPPRSSQTSPDRRHAKGMQASQQNDSEDSFSGSDSDDSEH